MIEERAFRTFVNYENESIVVSFKNALTACLDASLHRQRSTIGDCRNYVSCFDGKVHTVIFPACFFCPPTDETEAELFRNLVLLCEEAALTARFVCRDHAQYVQYVRNKSGLL